MIPHDGQTYEFRIVDALRSNLADAITPSRIASVVKAADYAYLNEWLELWQEMRNRDPHLYTVAEKRRMGIGGIPWNVGPDPEAEDQDAAKRVADHCAKVLRKCEGVDEAIWHLTSALGPNIAVVEKVFDGPRLRKLVPVPHTRIGQWLYDKPGVRISLDGTITNTVYADPRKYIVAMPHGSLISPTWDCPMRAILLPWVGKHYAFKDWLHFIEKFGWPFIYGEFPEGTSEADKSKLLGYLNALAATRTAAIKAGTSLKIEQAARLPDEPFLPLIQYVDEGMSKIMLGQTMTTDAPDTGTYAYGKIAKDVQSEVAYSDYVSEQRYMHPTMQQLAYIEFGPPAPCPVWKREIEESADYESITKKYEGAKVAGVKSVSKAQVVADFGLNAPNDEDDTLSVAEVPTAQSLPGEAAPDAPIAPSTEPLTLNELTLGIERFTRAGNLAWVNLLSAKLAELIGVTAPPPLNALPTAPPTGGDFSE